MYSFGPPRKRRWAAGLLVCAAALLAALPMTAQPPAEKKAVPSEAVQGRAEAVITRLFAAKFKDAKTDKTAAQSLAAELLAQGKITKDDDSLQFMAFKLASELAARAGDNAGALEAIEELAKAFKVDTLDMKSDIYAQVEKNTNAKEDAQNLTESVLNLVEEALELDNFGAADKLMVTAEKAAGKSEKLALYAKVEKRAGEVKDAKKAFDGIKASMDQLAKEPANAKASLEVGKYYAFVKGKYDKALPLLAKGSDKTLKDLAERDLDNPKEARKQVDLADDWYKLGEAEKGLAQRQTFRRAYHWYQESLAKLEGLTRVRVEKSVEELAKLFPTGTGGAVALTSEITGELRNINPAHNGGVQSVALSSDGKQILSGGSSDNTVRLWDASNGMKKREFFGHNGSIQSVAISADGKLGLSGSTDNKMFLWNLESGQQVKQFFGHNDWVRSVAFLPGNRVISACDDRSIRIFDVSNGNVIKTLTGHTNYINGMSISKDGKRAVTGGVDMSVRVWNLETGAEIKKMMHSKSVQQVAISPDGKRVVSTSFDNTVKVWDAESGNEIKALTHPGMVWNVVISPDGRRVYTGCGGGMVLNDGTVQFNDKNNQIRVFDLASGKELRVLNGHTNYVRALDFSADGRFLVSGSQDNTLRLWGAK